MNSADFQARYQMYQQAAETYLSGLFAKDKPYGKLYEAMRYSLLSGGKRLRPVLTLEFAHLGGLDWQLAVPYACALELVHTYSLIHDDLPCMDNDDYRRGRLTNHKVYGEAAAVLAGDGLLTAAFEAASNADADPETVVAVVRTLSGCAGELGMVGGQMLDLEGETRPFSDEEIHTVQSLKTGALLAAACRLGVLTAGGSEEQLCAAEAYARSLGLAFQMQDDILDVTGDFQKLGKKTGMDEHKNTFVRLYGVERCREMVREETARAVGALSRFPDRAFLTALAEALAVRDH